VFTREGWVVACSMNACTHTGTFLDGRVSVGSFRVSCMHAHTERVLMPSLLLGCSVVYLVIWTVLRDVVVVVVGVGMVSNVVVSLGHVFSMNCV
jgi:hypothetical protein